jgi:hypothetical protein
MGCCSVCGRNWITGLTSAASPVVDIWSTCKVRHTLGEFLYLLICSFLLCLSWLLYCRVRKSRRDLWITLYMWWISSYITKCAVYFIMKYCVLIYLQYETNAESSVLFLSRSLLHYDPLQCCLSYVTRYHKELRPEKQSNHPRAST